MKRVRWLVLILLGLGVAGFFIWQKQPQLLSSLSLPQLPWGDVSSVTQQMTDKLQPAIAQTQPIVTSLASEGALVASRAATVLSTTTGLGDVATQPTTLLEGTAQYARYWYCKQVVDSYEKQYQPR